jgi:hypothetical protein
LPASSVRFVSPQSPAYSWPEDRRYAAIASSAVRPSTVVAVDAGMDAVDAVDFDEDCNERSDEPHPATTAAESSTSTTATKGLTASSSVP